MGKGGQDRDGKKMKELKALARSAIGFEVVESSDFVNVHSFVKPDATYAERRLFHRPRLMKSAAAHSRRWMLSAPASRRAPPPSATASGALLNPDGSLRVPESDGASQLLVADSSNVIEVTREADLDLPPPKGETLLALEYSEERPPLLLNKGMA
jgi:hypothetical protein